MEKLGLIFRAKRIKNRTEKLAKRKTFQLTNLVIRKTITIFVKEKLELSEIASERVALFKKARLTYIKICPQVI